MFEAFLLAAILALTGVAAREPYRDSKGRLVVTISADRPSPSSSGPRTTGGPRNSLSENRQHRSGSPSSSASYNEEENDLTRGINRGGITNVYKFKYSANPREKLYQLKEIQKSNPIRDERNAYWFMAQKEIEEVEKIIQEEDRKIAKALAKEKAKKERKERSEEYFRQYAEQIARTEAFHKAQIDYVFEQARISSDTIKTEGEYRNEIERVTEKRNKAVERHHKRINSGKFLETMSHRQRATVYEQAAALSYSHEFIREADTQFTDHNDSESGELALKVAEALVDITTSLFPGVSWGRDIYEAISGRSLINGNILSDFEMGTAVFGAVTAGFGSKILKGMKVLERVGVKATDLHRLIDWSVFTKRAENAKAIKLPYDLPSAVQDMSDAALYARFQAENGQTLYKVGAITMSETTNSQFWSLRNPLTVKKFSQKYGIKESIAAEFDFIQTAVLKDGVNFVTRKSTSQGANLGGEIEVVVDIGDVVLQSFHTIEKGVIK